jgi:hypothetical protein
MNLPGSEENDFIENDGLSGQMLCSLVQKTILSRRCAHVLDSRLWCGLRCGCGAVCVAVCGLQCGLRCGTTVMRWSHRRITRGGQGLPKVSLGPAMPYGQARPVGGPYGRFRGSPPARRVACGLLLPPWTPHTVRLWLECLTFSDVSLDCHQTEAGLQEKK